MQKHNYTIDALRFVAALMVVLFHLNQAIVPFDNWYRNTVKHGALGVPVFFVISGYCIIISAQNSVSIKDFLTKRFFRIYPAYWVSLIIVFISACFQKLYLGTNVVHNLPRNFQALIASFTLTTSPLTKIETMNWVYWSLTCEVLFYLAIGAMLLLNNKVMIYALIALSLLSALLPVQHTGILFFLDQWPAFGIGICGYYLFNCSDTRSWLEFAVLFSANLLALFLKFTFQLDYILFTLATFMILCLSNYVNLPKNVFSILGRYSYSVYLVHVPVGVFILGMFEGNFVMHNPTLNLIYDLAVYTIISGIAWLMFKYIETPAIAYGRKASTRYVQADPVRSSR